jgi:HEAT repeat protein
MDPGEKFEKKHLPPELEKEYVELLRRLKDPNPNVRLGAAERIGQKLDELGGARAKPVVSGLVELLKDPSARNRWHAALYLGAIGPEAKAAVPALVEMFKTDKEGFLTSNRVQAAATLGAMGPDARPATTVLLEALDDDDDLVRRWAAVSLIRIGPPKEIFPSLTKALKGRKIKFDHRYADALEEIDPDSAAVPFLLEVLAPKDEGGELLDDELRAIRFFGLIGPEAKEAVPFLLHLLKDEFFGKQAAKSLKLIDPVAAAKAGVP